MKLPIEFNAPVMVLGGGDVTDDAFSAAFALTKYIVAADGGGNEALSRGAEIAAVIGDLDSLSDRAREAIPPEKVVEIAEQESTDFDKTIRSIRAPIVVAVGFTGGRTDHELAAFHVLARYADRAVIVVGKDDITFNTPRTLRLAIPVGTLLSFFPLAQVRAKASGLLWPKGPFDIAFDPLRRIGTSNAVASTPVSIETDGPGLLTIVPRDILGQVASDLSGAVFHSRGG